MSKRCARFSGRFVILAENTNTNLVLATKSWDFLMPLHWTEEVSK